MTPQPLPKIDRCSCGWWKYADNDLCVHCSLEKSKRAEA